MKRWSLFVVCLLVGGLLGSAATTSFLKGQPQTPPVFPKELTSYRDVVKTVLPAVVSIQARQVNNKVKQTPQRAPLFDNQQLPEEFRRFFEQMPHPDQQGPRALGFGSGFLIDPKGLILTNYHVVDGADQVEVTLRDGRKFLSKDVKSDAKTDLAIVKIEVKEALPYLELGDSDAMEIGDRVLAVGAPFGLTGTVTAGIVSGKGRSLHLNQYEDFVQTDAAINPGNSGGPLVNLEGRVVGINSAIKSRTGGSQGVGMAISSNMVKNVKDQLLRDGVVHRGYLGVQIKDVDNADLAHKLGLKDTHGALVTQVFKKTPASNAGLADGDVIVDLNGKPVQGGAELQKVVASLPLNKPVDLTVVRDGKTKELKVTIEEQPKEYGLARVPVPQTPNSEKDSVNLDKIGVDVSDLTPELAERYGFDAAVKGAVITGVDGSGLGSVAGLRRGMVITKVDRKPVTSADKLKEAVNAGSLKEGILLQVQSPQGGTNFVVIKAN